MINRAIVAGIGETWIDCLSLDETERAHDESCGTGSCKSGGCGCRVSGHPFRAARPKNLNVRVGDTVEISPATGRAALASLLILGLPVLAGIGAWFLGNALFPEFSEGARAGIAALGLVAAAGLTVMAGSRGRNNRLPEITAVRS